MIVRACDSETRELAAGIISNGGLIAFRTDTFYGVGADPLSSRAVGRIKSLKGREEGKPILVLIADLVNLEILVSSVSPLCKSLMSSMWPGPLTIVMPAVDELPVELTAGTGTIGVRLPTDENVRSFVRECGGRLTATSANPSGSEPAKSAADVVGYFPKGLDLVVDGGTVTAIEPSTVIDMVGPSPRLIREGAVSRSALEDVLGMRIG
jgi:L-threonylcarbamoyladenylate synthase